MKKIANELHITLEVLDNSSYTFSDSDTDSDSDNDNESDNDDKMRLQLEELFHLVESTNPETDTLERIFKMDSDSDSDSDNDNDNDK